MKLKHELKAIADEFKASAPAQVIETLEQGIRIAESSTSAKDVDDVAPDFELTNASGTSIRLDELLSSGPVVVSFYRGGWCPFCNLELRSLQTVLPEIKALGGSLVAISPESPDETLSTSEKQELDFQVLSDPGSVVARSFGVSFTLDESSKEVYQDFGIDLPVVNGSTTWELPIPATFVIGNDGVITYAHVDADYRRRPNPAQVVKAVQHTTVELAKAGMTS